jgi:hypothetical protein
MTYIRREDIDEYLSQLDSRVFSPAVYSAAGVFILRDVIPTHTVALWQHAWESFHRELADRKIDPFNPVVVHEEVPQVLADIHRCPELLDTMQTIYPDLALYMQRFVVKDRKSRAPVFLHHDFGYDLGWPEKTAIFVPLSEANERNGGLTFYPGTHLLGYMGDVGEINPDVLDPDWPTVSPALRPGDVAMMHECTWHSSSIPANEIDRVLVQITYQPASDPSSVALLRGEWRTNLRLGDVPRSSLFRRSRSSRLIELQTEVDRLRGQE